jgi:hypothetical protein
MLLVIIFILAWLAAGLGGCAIIAHTDGELTSDGLPFHLLICLAGPLGLLAGIFALVNAMPKIILWRKK